MTHTFANSVSKRKTIHCDKIREKITLYEIQLKELMKKRSWNVA